MIEIFFDVPVYRIGEKDYNEQMRLFVEKQMTCVNGKPDEMKQKYFEKYPDQADRFRDYLHCRFGGGWLYNEIIGYIRLHFLGNQIRGEYYQVKAKRIYKTRKKLFQWYAWKLAPEISIPEKSINPEIYSIILKYLMSCSKELKGRYIDTEILKRIGPYVDWQNLLRNHHGGK